MKTDFFFYFCCIRLQWVRDEKEESIENAMKL